MSRYAKVLATNNDRVQRDGILGSQSTGRNVKVKNTIIFGPDKIHWPQTILDPAVWAVPESTLPKKAFGPKTDTDMFTIRPKYLNSGTIMGPVGDLREMFAATVDMLSRKFDENWELNYSDQYIFAEVWGEQEVGRRKLQYGKAYADEAKRRNENITVPDVPEHKRVEYHICLDYESELFQAATAWERSLAWMRFSDGTPLPKEGKETWSEKEMKDWKLREDVASSEAPFKALESVSPMNDTAGKSWEEVMLGTNTVSQNPFPLFHVTGNKQVRDWWWPRMWFHPYGDELLKATKKKGIPPGKIEDQAFAKVDGKQWFGAKPVQAGMRIDNVGKGGAWGADKGEWLGWSGLCGVHEEVLYLREKVVKEGVD